MHKSTPDQFYQQRRYLHVNLRHKCCKYISLPNVNYDERNPLIRFYMRYMNNKANRTFRKYDYPTEKHSPILPHILHPLFSYVLPQVQTWITRDYCNRIKHTFSLCWIQHWEWHYIRTVTFSAAQMRLGDTCLCILKGRPLRVSKHDAEYLVTI